MPFGLGKSEKQATEEVGSAPVKTHDGDPAAPVAEAEGDVTDAGNGSTPSPSTPVAPGYPEEAASRAQTATPPPQGDAFFVSVSRQDAVETHRFDSPIDAQTLVEALLEQGVAEGDVAVYSGRRLALRVSHRPIVKLTGAHED